MLVAQDRPVRGCRRWKDGSNQELIKQHREKAMRLFVFACGETYREGQTISIMSDRNPA